MITSAIQEATVVTVVDNLQNTSTINHTTTLSCTDTVHIQYITHNVFIISVRLAISR
jgi:hypothetical protein